MSDTKCLNNLRDNVVRDLRRAEQRAALLLEQRDHSQQAAETQAAQLKQIEDLLALRVAAALERLAADPGHQGRKAAAREARGALKAFYVVTGRSEPDLPVPSQGRGGPRTVPDHVAHGTTNAYGNYRCRCEPCKAASQQAQRDRRQRRMEDRVIRDGRRWFHPRADHGTYNGYTNYGCRCDPCIAAGHAYNSTKKESVA